jgi:hypothetical protein
LGTWGSVDIGGAGCKEVDFTVGYSIVGIDIAVTDYWWAGESTAYYFNYGDHKRNGVDTKSDHIFEAAVAYTLPVATFPLKLAVSSFFAGNDYTYDNAGKELRAHSTYIEASYPFTVKKKDVTLEVAAGVSLVESPIYGNEKFAMTNLALKGSKEIKITDSFSLSVFTQLVLNPSAENVFLVFGITF